MSYFGHRLVQSLKMGCYVECMSFPKIGRFVYIMWYIIYNHEGEGSSLGYICQSAREKNMAPIDLVFFF